MEIISSYDTVAKFTHNNKAYSIQIHKSGDDDSRVKFVTNVIQVSNTIVEPEFSIRICEKTTPGARVYYTLIVPDNIRPEDKQAIADAINSSYLALPGFEENDPNKASKKAHAVATLARMFREGKISLGKEIIKSSVLNRITHSILSS